MHFKDLEDVCKLPSPQVIDGREYVVEERSLIGQILINNERVVWRTKNGILIELFYYSFYRDDPVERQTLGTLGWKAFLKLDGVELVDDRGWRLTFQDTAEIPDTKLRVLVEQAITDLSGEERRLDPSGRHAKEAQRAARTETRQQAEADRIAARTAPQREIFERLKDE
jgi:hypothetical protein